MITGPITVIGADRVAKPAHDTRQRIAIGQFTRPRGPALDIVCQVETYIKLAAIAIPEIAAGRETANGDRKIRLAEGGSGFDAAVPKA